MNLWKMRKNLRRGGGRMEKGWTARKITMEDRINIISQWQKTRINLDVRVL